jgi:hypothetical protein
MSKDDTAEKVWGKIIAGMLIPLMLVAVSWGANSQRLTGIEEGAEKGEERLLSIRETQAGFTKSISKIEANQAVITNELGHVLEGQKENTELLKQLLIQGR